VAFVADDVTVRALLERRAAADPNGCYLAFAGERLTFGELDAGVNRLANALAARGIGAGDRVAVMMDNHPDHVRAFFALAKLGAVHIPVNTQLRHDPLGYVLSEGAPALLLADVGYAPVIEEAAAGGARPAVVWRGDGPPPGERLDGLMASAACGPPPGAPHSADVLTVLFTSGTTGPPKGVLVTDKMHRASALASSLAADARDGDVFYLWEPLYHIGGMQVLVLALEHRVTIAMTTRFSASRLWDECREVGATQIHFLGGILQMLLSRPPDPRDREHPVRIAWGGGAPPDAWRAFEARFGVEVRESYGMTEASSLTSINTDARFATVGRPAPWFEVRIAGEDAVARPAGERGEILVRGREPGLITPGYFRNPEATARSLRDGWLHTGDLGLLDEDGYLVFLGRLKDCIRRRGENVSAWEIEHAVDAMPEVQESAAIGVPSDFGDEEIKLFVKPVAGASVDPGRVFEWCAARLSPFQVPLYLEVVDAFEKTGTQRIRKETLSRSVAGCSVRPGAG
jgi:crotonobetaine/carnitine-CoA ligase